MGEARLNRKGSPPNFPALVQQFFTEYLVAQRALSPRTVACYRDAMTLFLGYAAKQLGKPPIAMQLVDITPELILKFLAHLEHERHNSVRSRNLRLTALRAFLKFAGRRDVTALHAVERANGRADETLRAAAAGSPDAPGDDRRAGTAWHGWTSQRDHLLLSLLYNTGARVSEIVGVRVVDVVLDGAACVHLHGKGRKDRSVPLWKTTAAAIRAWLNANPHLRDSAALLPNRSGHPMTRCNVAQRLALAVDRPAQTTEPEDQARIPAYPEAHDSHASSAKRRAVQRDRTVARSREHEHDAPLRRGQPGDEGEGTCPARST